MRWMETIRARFTEADRRGILEDLADQLSRLAPPAGLEEARLYVDARVATDLGIHLGWNTPRVKPEGSILGRRLAAGLRSAGTVNHAVWREEVCR